MVTQILIVEDDPVQREMLSTLLRRKLECHSHLAEHGRDALDILEQDTQNTIKLVIMDLEMPVMGGLETLEIMQQSYPSLPVVMLTGSKDIDHAVRALKLGATDFLSKPFEGERMITTIKNALKLSLLTKEVSRLKSEKEGYFTFENLIGYAGGLQEQVAIGRKAASADIPILITGETGTGKEVFAQAIHGASPRAGKPFIAVNCGAIPEKLVESTLFGHEKGAFTGATEQTTGKFREADGGTIFLDEIGELPKDTQVKLLRVLQEREVEPVGASKAVPVNVKIISATNRDLEDEVIKSNFREDLFFRLNVLKIHLPALRDRRQDISQLVQHFVDRYCADNNQVISDVTDRAMETLTAHDWPGNVRELENIIFRTLVMSDDNILDIENLSSVFISNPEDLSETVMPKGQTINIMNDNGDFKSIDDIEQEAMRAALNHFEDNTTQAAKALGMAKSTFYRKIRS